ncbi:MAG: distal tail protein Dit [Acutalibacteraceae bacterium]
MNNYIIWKGQDSRNLKGLLISELPHIVRPATRVQVVEIEGRDGDVSDNIGYAAYDKLVKIGLYDNYDVDRISHFFSGTGKVIFSNEPDKYYESEITEQIDFERLVRFRTAVVKFHTQPFKYLVDEKPVETEINDEIKEIKVMNVGFEESKPIITLTGKDTVEISVNGYAQFQVNIDDGYITVNSKLQECYKDNTYNLKNHNMGGEFPVLQPGENTVTWTGNLTKIKVELESRWL